MGNAGRREGVDLVMVRLPQTHSPGSGGGVLVPDAKESSPIRRGCLVPTVPEQKGV
jgi:hypothetical protein